MDTIFYVILIVLLFVFSYVFLLYDYQKKFTLFEKLGIPGPKPHFIIGNAFKISFDNQDSIKWYARWQKEYGKVYGYYSGTLPCLVVTDIELIKMITVRDFDHFADRWLTPPMTTRGNRFLFNMNGQRWFDIRRILSPIFSGNKLRHLTPIISKTVGDFDTALKRILEKNVDCDVYDRFRRYTLDTIGQSALAMKINCQLEEHSNFYNGVKGVTIVQTSKIFRIWFAFPHLMSRIFKYPLKFHPFIKTMQFIVDNLTAAIKVRKNFHSASATSSKKTVDMLQLMLDAATEANLSDMSITNVKPLDDEEIISNCFAFVFAGFETVAACLSQVSYLLAVHPEIQEKVYQEIVAEVKDLANVTYDEANNLHYLNQVIKEALRLYPIAPVINRMCNKDYEYKGLKIPKGVRIDIPVYAVHHDPEIWPDPETFDPDRFSSENRGNMNVVAHMPFGVGPRNCIGIRFAMLEMKLALISLLSRYRLCLPSTPKLPPEQEFPTGVYHPFYGIYLRMEPRN